MAGAKGPSTPPRSGRASPEVRPSLSGPAERRKRLSPKMARKKLSLFASWPGKGDGKDASDVTAGPPQASRMSPPEEQCCEGASPEPTVAASYPAALRVMWEAVGRLRSGIMDEMDAARHVLNNVRVSDHAAAALVLQCPCPLPAQHRRSNVSISAASTPPSLSPFASMPGLPSAVHELFRAPPQSHTRSRDMPGPSPSRRGNVDGHGNTPLHWAAFKNSVRAMDVLLSPRPGGDGPSSAADARDAVRRLVNVRAQPSGWTPLHDAAYSNAADAVSRLIAAGADVDARSNSGATPLCFAAQEDAPDAARRLLAAGADPAARCLGSPGHGGNVRANNADRTGPLHSRFSGYTPLHYCAHYDASRAARVLLEHGGGERGTGGIRGGGRGRSLSHPLPAGHFHASSGANLLEIPDLNDKLPIHVAAARGSSGVLRELLHGGARLETRAALSRAPSSPGPSRGVERAETTEAARAMSAPLAIPARVASASDAGANDGGGGGIHSPSNSPTSVASHHAPVSSPILRAMIPSQPIQSSKPWNCLSQKSIDACRHLIHEAEMNWTPGRHGLFAPADRAAVVEVLRVGKRLERMGLSEGLGAEGVGKGIFLDLWPRVLSYCGRGWFEQEGVEGGLESEEEEKLKPEGKKMPAARGSAGRHEGSDNEEEISMQSSTSSHESASGGDEAMEEEFTQFQLDEASESMGAIL